jgi:pimeloyl-ACP methyl ester carboxylesterase
MFSYGKSFCLLEYGRILTLLLSIVVLSGCAGPIGVTKVSPHESYNLNTENALEDGKISEDSKTILQRYNLLAVQSEEPWKTIEALNVISQSDDRRDILFALSELSYLRGQQIMKSSADNDRWHAQDVFLQSAVYAYFYLLGDGREAPPNSYDRRFRDACDLYNRSLYQAFPADDKGGLNLSSGLRHLPGGDLSLILKTDTLAWDYAQFEGLFPADSYAVRGFTVRNRSAGLGMPLVGLTRKSIESPNGGALPITAFLRVSGDLKEYQQGRSQAFLELYSALDDAKTQVKDKSVPLEADVTTPLAYRLNDSRVWTLGERRFLTGADVPIRVLLIQPYEPGRIPVVFVHGTASSPVWWAEMLNSLRADSVIRKKFQFWFYQYNSSNMVALSAAELRESLIEMVHRLDPQQKDPALQNMVVIGHSQGGLLTKMTAVNPGDGLFNAISDIPVDEMKASPEIKNLIRRLLLFEPLPFVKRVVYISTPHRGSYLSKEWIRSFVQKVVSLPFNIVVNSQEFLSTLNSQLKVPASIKGRIPTSIDGMSADNPLLKALVALPTAPGVSAHSIIAVKPGMDITTGNDGVVEYQSAHIDGVESEFIVRAEHSCQSHPFVIEEVRRILLKHTGIDNAWQAPAEEVPGQVASILGNKSAQ